MSTGVSKKRFIAGAICPQCGAEDTVFVVVSDADSMRGCVKCDFTESLSEVVSHSESDMEANAVNAAGDELSPVRIVGVTPTPTSEQ